MSGQVLLLINLGAAFFLTGLSWFLQIVQFPLLLRLDGPDFSKLAALHRRRNTMLMAGPMVVEMAAAIGLLARPEFPHRDVFHAFVLLLAIWIITFFQHIPLHRRLLNGYDLPVLQSLEKWNWVRTACWTARSVLLVLIARVCYTA